MSFLRKRESIICSILEIYKNAQIDLDDLEFYKSIKNLNKQKLYNEIVEFLKSQGATKIAVFGSYVRDEETPKSDIDIMVDFENIGLFEFLKIERELGEHIGIKVDLVMEGCINPLVEKYVNQDLLVLYR